MMMSTTIRTTSARKNTNTTTSKNSSSFTSSKSKKNETFNNEQIDKPEPQQSELALESEKTLERNLNESGSLNNNRSEFFINETNYYIHILYMLL